jgi:hypothetical protein
MRLPATLLLIAVGCTLWNQAGPAQAEDVPLRQAIDAAVRAGWEKDNVTPAGPADDAAFLRRVYLDLCGTLPTGAEAAAFLKDSAADKRVKLIDKLLDDPRYAEHQANVWDLLFFGRHPADSELVNRREGFQKWLREKFAKNDPYDRWARELLMAEGPTYEGPTMFYAQYRGHAEDATEAISRIFLGTQLQCARCHDHPFDKWKQTDFYGMTGFFVRLAYVDTTNAGKRHYIVTEKSSGDVMFSGSAKDQQPGKKGEPVAPRFLGGDLLEEPPLPAGFKEPELKGLKTAPPKPLFSRKQKFAEWATAADNPYFAKAVVNRLWGQFMGRGLFDPVDDLRANRQASHPQLFQALQAQFVAHQFDMKWLIRELVNSAPYQMAAKGGGSDAAPRTFERARVRPLSAEEMMSALRVATGFDAAIQAAGGKPEAAKMPEEPYFRTYYGQPTNGRGDFQPGLGEHLFMNNSSGLRQAMIQARKGNLADSLLTSKAPWEERVDQLFLAVLTRLPKEPERQKFVEYLAADEKNPAPAIEDAIWVLLNTSEFRFNH